MGALGYETEESIGKVIAELSEKAGKLKNIQTRVKKAGGRVEMEGTLQDEKALTLISKWMVNLELGLMRIEHGV